ncbi:MAG: GHMP kinase [Saprospiraceae bacterium]|nr:GHMP kinase [Saprospiraceae bacterium]HAV29569.1 GHMP kinase [Saprospirales bacterium]|tara:strand:- start:1440 stop:2249 length:810 start_codon:yes stop_codon:yes gene_type:complete
MTVKNTRGSDLIWESLTPEGKSWFNADFAILDFKSNKTTNLETSLLLMKIFKGAINLNSEFLSKWNGFKVETQLEFPQNWGLGSSSTLIHLVAQWADVNPLELYYKVFSGSGFDVACAGADGPITFFSNDEEIGYTSINWAPSFTKNIYFVHLNEKADSQIAVKDYFKKAKKRKQLAADIDAITKEMVNVSSLSKFEELIDKHESILSKSLDLPTIKEERFSDFQGCVKSLGAWGGDFALVTGSKESDLREYFTEKGHDTVLSYADLIL